MPKQPKVKTKAKAAPTALRPKPIPLYQATSGGSLSSGSELTPVSSSNEGTPVNVTPLAHVDSSNKRATTRPTKKKSKNAADQQREQGSPAKPIKVEVASDAGSKPQPKARASTERGTRTSERISNKAKVEPGLKQPIQMLSGTERKLVEKQCDIPAVQTPKAVEQEVGAPPKQSNSTEPSMASPTPVDIVRPSSPEWDDNLIKHLSKPNTKRAREADEPIIASQASSSSSTMPSQIEHKAAKKPKIVIEEDEEDDSAEEDPACENVDDANTNDASKNEKANEDQQNESEQSEDESEISETEEPMQEDPFSKMHPVVRHIFQKKLQDGVLRSFYLELAQRSWITSYVTTLFHLGNNILRVLMRMRAGKLLPYAARLAREPESAHVVPAKYRKILPHLNQAEQTAVLRMMAFERHDQYLNICRSSPFVVRAGRNLESVVISAAPALNLPAIFVSLGLAQGSELLHGSGDENRLSRKLYVQLLAQEFQYVSSFICTVMRDDIVHCPIYGAALHLQSKKQDFAGATFGSTPSKEGMVSFADNHKDKKGKKKSKDNAENVPPDLPYLLYNHGVPVYDGRPDTATGNKGFRPSSKAWKKLSSMNRYFDEIPDRSIVIAGFTMSGPWKLKGNPAHATAHFNLMFAILLTNPLPEQSGGSNAAAEAGSGEE
ncbi:hypothetical protein VNI00_012577 [Paramarasmius palmivorus]|uniref:Uncharacterized protein n=1 Tax=Paramarasmius palmivorus TaxID=297713 RepID=A0AAW0C8E5_9AGAR